jgi:hypothetical protein
MSIAITGPEKYDLQDLVCAEIAIRFETSPDSVMILEPADGEDAELTFTVSGQRRVVEIQVKGSSGQVTLSTIAGCLAHFPGRSSVGCLFERLISGDRIVVLVMSGRCNDAAARYLVGPDWRIEHERDRSFRRQEAKALLDEFNRVKPKGSKQTNLRVAREAKCRQIATTTSIDTLRTAARRLFLVELATDFEVRSRCEEHLRTRYRIPGDRTAAVLGEVVRSLKRAKKDRIDAMPLVREVVRRNAAPPLLPDHYIERGAEASWVAELSSNNVLLLSGPPRCGKSDAARRVASELQRLGYKIRLGDDADAAYRYLSSPRDAHRLYLLDDPLGGLRLIPDASAVLDRLRKIISGLTAGCKLIVVQNQHLLTEGIRKDRLEDCGLLGHPWHDLGVTSGDFLARVWMELATAAGVAQDVQKSLAAALRDGQVALEPGCLRHLASTSDDLPDRPAIDDMVRKAREDAADLGRALADESDLMEELLAVLAIGSTPTEPIAIAEIAFLASSEEAPLPGKSMGYRVVSRGATSAPPAYAIPPIMVSGLRMCLDRLERRQFVREGPISAFGFSHAYYRAAAETVLRPDTMFSRGRAIRIARRSLFCASPVTSRAAARNLDWLFASNVRRRQIQEAVVELAVEGLGSVFPASRDLCFAFLVRHLRELPAAQATDLPKWVTRAVSISLDDVAWRDGEAWLPEEHGFSWRRSASPDHQHVRDEIKAAEGNTDFAPERAALLLLMLGADPSVMSSRCAARLLRFDEAIIRAEAARLWLTVPRSGDADLLRVIFGDQHPLVAQGTLEGTLFGWQRLSEARRSKLLDHLGVLAAVPVAAAALLDMLLVFNRVEHTGENPPWAIFERIFPLVLSALPTNVRFDDARLFGVMESAAETLDAVRATRICSEWIGLLQREIAAGSLPSDFALGVAEIVVKVTERDPPQRAGMIQQLLGFESTGALMSFLKDFVGVWEHLIPGERKAVVQLLREDRRDGRWLQAAAITRRHVPEEVQQAVFGDGAYLNRPADAFLGEIPPSLLAAAVAVECGHPQPFWYLGIHHAGGKFAEAIGVIQGMPEHPLFEVAFEAATDSQDDDRIASVVRHAGPAHSELLFHLLLRANIEINAFFPKTWSTLIGFGQGEQRTEWFDRMSEAAPRIMDDLGDIRHWFKEEDYRSELMRRLGNDIAALNVAFAFEDLPPETRISEVEARFESEMIKMIREYPPRLHGTYSDLQDVLRATGGRFTELKSVLEEGRQSAIREKFEVKEHARKRETPPADWMGP